ncbi:MAG: hypothetical protein HFE33_03730 [Clostridia bacterium]|jgi:hypothetical protein|nr:hypothetical protein [Clostridia bacterium]MCI9291242.1 hypothetical protein [Clostridia bacterium]
MDNKLKKAKITLLIGVILLTALTLIVVGELISIYCYDDGYGDMAIYYDDLKTVMSNDVLYLSPKFAEDNNLQIRPIRNLQNNPDPDAEHGICYGDEVGEVYLEFNPNKVKFGQIKSISRYDYKFFNGRVKNIDLYRYELQTIEGYDGIPVRVNICGAVGLVKNRKYDNSIPNGDSYAILDDSLTTYITGKGKSYEVKGVVGKFGVIKKYSRLKITVTVDADKLDNYTEDEIEKRVNEVLSSALNYIER